MIVLDVDAEDIGAVAMAAAAWLMGLPVQRDDEDNLRRLAGQVEAVLGQLTDVHTGAPVRLVEEWWK